MRDRRRRAGDESNKTHKGESFHACNVGRASSDSKQLIKARERTPERIQPHDVFVLRLGRFVPLLAACWPPLPMLVCRETKGPVGWLILDIAARLYRRLKTTARGI